MKTFISFIIISLSSIIIAFSQTKLIAHKSHSGKSKNFHTAMLFHSNLKSSDFGVGIEPTVEHAKLDTLKYISDSVSVMVTSYFCDDSYTLRRRLKKKTDTLPSRFEQINTEEKWSAGTDTLYNHPLFSKKNALDSIKKILKENYNFKNNIDSVKFIGYNTINNTIINEKKEESLPPIFNSKRKTNLNLKVIGILIITLLALTIGLIFNKMHHKNKVVG